MTSQTQQPNHVPSEAERKSAFRHKLRSISLTNFKAFGKIVTIPIRPITLIFGANSAGKSSIIHGLLFIHHLATSKETTRLHNVTHTSLGGTLVDLGGYPHLVYRHSEELHVGLDISIDTFHRDAQKNLKFAHTIRHEINIGRVLHRRNTYMRREVLLDDESLFNVSTNIDRLSDESGANSTDYAAHPFILDQIRSRYDQLIESFSTHFKIARSLTPGQKNDMLSALDLAKTSTRDFEEFKKIIENHVTAADRYSIFNRGVNFEIANKLRFFITPNQENIQQAFFNALLQSATVRNIFHNHAEFRAYCLKNREIWPESDKQRHELALQLADKFNSFDYLMGRLRYIGPIRRIPTRFFRDLEETRPLTSDGSSAWHRLALSATIMQKLNETLKRFEIQYAFIAKNTNVLQADRDTLNTYLRDVVKEAHENPAAIDAMTAELRRHLSASSGSPYIELVDTQGTHVSHRDVGIGISQVVPVLVNCYAESNATICIEQPELHLHPRLQGDLADVFIETALHGEQHNAYIIETHSEAIIRRLMRRVREGKISKDDISIVYVEAGSEGSTVTHIHLDDDGDLIDEWPNGFFEEGFRDNMAGR